MGRIPFLKGVIWGIDSNWHWCQQTKRYSRCGRKKIQYTWKESIWIETRMELGRARCYIWYLLGWTLESRLLGTVISSSSSSFDLLFDT